MIRNATFHSESGRWHVTEGQDTIACVYSCGDYRKERAEAHVMAAAQEMLEALHKVLSVMPVLPDSARHIVGMAEAYEAALKDARGAIAKATKA